MKKTITAEQITEWFTAGTKFAGIRITDGLQDEPKAVGVSAESGTADGTVEQSSPRSSVAEGCSRAQSSTGSSSTQSPGSPKSPGTYEYRSLPITKNRQELISLIENNSVVIVRGATGSGKTTQLPQFILDYYREKGAPCNIVVTQPRRIAAISIARWVAHECRCALGSLVGYQVSLTKVASDQTRLIYVTTGVLLQKLVFAKSLTEFSHIFIDEVHERTEELDFLLLVVRKLLHSNSRYVKVILMSATINCRELAEYFGTPVRNHVNPAYVFEVDGAPYTVEEFFLDDLRSKFNHMVEHHDSEEPCITTEMYDMAVSLIQSFDELENKDQSSAEAVVSGDVALPNRGSVLVFLPGLLEIQYMQEALANLVRKRLQVYPLHSTITLEEQHALFLVPIPGYRKVILSTNIAESSVTVPDVKYVIDFCLARQLFWDKKTHYQSLCLTWASKTSCNQRRGRAGRVSKGYCYRLVTRKFWRTAIPEYMTPEMLRSPLATTMLKVKLLDMGDPRSLLSTALSPPHLNDIERTVLQLKEQQKLVPLLQWAQTIELGALSLEREGEDQRRFDGDLTFLGRVLAQLPVNLHLGKLIVLGHAFGCLEECLILAACMSLKSFFAMPSLQRLTGYRNKLAFANGIPSDSIAVVSAFKVWHTSRHEGAFRHPKDELDWGKENCIQIKRIREVAELFEDLKTRVSHFNMRVTEKAPPKDYESVNKQTFILQVAIAGAFYPNYFNVGEIDEELAFKELCGHNPKTTVQVRNIPSFGFLYYKQLQSLFRQCGPVKSITYDGSRAYMEFYKTSARGTGVLPEVSLALLMAQQRLPKDLLVYPSNAVAAKAGCRILSDIAHARVTVDLENHTVEPTSSVFDPEQFPPQPMFIVNITEVVEVGHFWGFQADEASIRKQGVLTADINGRQLQRLSGSVCPNLLCLAPYAEDQEEPLYFRAKVLHVSGSSVEVFFVDYGNTSQMDACSLRELPTDLWALPYQAQEFQIVGMCPSAQSLILGNEWSSAARNCFITLVSRRSLMASLFSVVHGVLRVHLHVNTDGVSLSVADIMIEKGHAYKVEESFQSKQSHDMLQSLYKDLQNGTFMFNPSSTSWVTHKKEQKELIESLLEAFSKSSQAAPKSQVPVHGPSSPYKMSFHCMNSVRQYRSVAIDMDSINSVAVNESLQDKHQRILLAGAVSVSGSSSNILLKETTLMPRIPGLPAILCMLFSPIMELRTDQDSTCFTGALCGLGWNSHTQEPVLVEHDMELDFDVRFDVEDITEINALRLAINSLVCEGPAGTLHLGQDRISELQQDVRDRVIRLFTKFPAREDVVPCYSEKLKTWNQIDPSQKMEPLQKADRDSRGAIFHLHPIPLLNV